jgi:hypothetical protein
MECNVLKGYHLSAPFYVTGTFMLVIVGTV